MTRKYRSLKIRKNIILLSNFYLKLISIMICKIKSKSSDVSLLSIYLLLLFTFRTFQNDVLSFQNLLSRIWKKKNAYVNSVFYYYFFNCRYCRLNNISLQILICYIIIVIIDCCRNSFLISLKMWKVSFFAVLCMIVLFLSFLCFWKIPAEFWI